MKIEEIEGIGPTYGAKLAECGCTTTDHLMDTCATAAGREKMANETGISAKLILTFVNHVDLMRLDGVGSEYADLLEASGVDSCTELAQRNAANLTASMAAANEAKALVRRLPSVEMTQRWIDEAKTVAKLVTH